jgi:hypothetical protein
VRADLTDEATQACLDRYVTAELRLRLLELEYLKRGDNEGAFACAYYAEMLRRRAVEEVTE